MIYSGQNEWKRGWRVLLSSGIGVGVGIPALVTSAGLFVIPMQEEFGWSRTALAIGPIVGMTYSLLSPLGGVITDRYGARYPAIIGLILLGISLILLSIVPVNEVAFYALVISLGLIGTVTSNIVYCKAIATWFCKHAGAAIACVLSGVSIIGAITQPLLAMVIEQYGWRNGYLMLSGMTLFIGLPIVLLWFGERREVVIARVESLDNVPGTTISQSIRDKRFWMILVAFGGAALPIGGFVNQLQPLLVSHNYDPTFAASLVGVFLLMTGVGRLVAGVLFDYFSPPPVAGLFLGLSALGALMLVFPDLILHGWITALSLSLIGLAQGAEADFMALFTLRIFGLRSFSTLFSMVVIASGVGYALGGIMFAVFYDTWGNYQNAVIVSAIVLGMSAFVAAIIRVPIPEYYEIKR